MGTHSQMCMISGGAVVSFLSLNLYQLLQSDLVMIHLQVTQKFCKNHIGSLKGHFEELCNVVFKSTHVLPMFSLGPRRASLFHSPNPLGLAGSISWQPDCKNVSDNAERRPFSPHKSPGKNNGVFFFWRNILLCCSVWGFLENNHKRSNKPTPNRQLNILEMYTQNKTPIYIQLKDDLGRLFSFGYGATPQVQNSVFQGVSISIDGERSFCEGYSFRVSRLVGFLNIYIYFCFL